MADTATNTPTREDAKRDISPPKPGPKRPPSTGLARTQMETEHGKTRIADGVVEKIAGLAAREIPGVHSMGAGMSRRMGQLRSMVPGSTGESLGQGVAVEVGELEAAVDLDIVTWYGQSIVDVTDAVRGNVIDRVEEMTGLKVVEVNINVDDVFVEGDDEDKDKEPRVQ
ncbi:Asp23/Gls24 family envelope stress response protein [Phytomonospora sp. NPDC050363]|uniref:Asp23/Gls24 family envelope stress response protein n=1 Tax=Phytomonospora sp. NPDC050363 TaxID=3155642 RepID=UPI003410128A